jgi:hypothetical protein
MAGVQRMLGDPVRSGDSGDPAAQRRQRVAQASSCQVGTDRLRTGRHRLEIVCLAPSLEMGEIGGIGPQRRGGVGCGLVGLGLRHRQGGARCRRLLVIGQAGQLAGSGGAEGVYHGRHESTTSNTREGRLSRVISPSTKPHLDGVDTIEPVRITDEPSVNNGSACCIANSAPRTLVLKVL